MRLQPYIPLHPDETALSFAGRLAMAHTGQPLARLLADMRINTEHFVLGRPDAISAFAETAGVGKDELLNATMRGILGGVEFRGERFHGAFLSRAADKFCPCCLAEDGDRQDWRQRLLWCFAPVHQCPRHRSRLERLAAPARSLQEGLSYLTLPYDDAATKFLPRYLSWLQSRLCRRYALVSIPEYTANIGRQPDAGNRFDPSLDGASQDLDCRGTRSGHRSWS